VQLLVVERAVVVLLKLVEECARGGLRLGKIDRSVVIGIKGSESRRRKKATRSSQSLPEERPPARMQGSRFSQAFVSS
jgi:hypothetical protein